MADGEAASALAPWGPEVDWFWEDFQVGQALDLGTHLITEAEITAFGRQFDPQPFHADRELAQTSVYKGLIASGWHSAAIWMRLYWETVLRRSASLGSPGVEHLDWLAPVRPGDVLRGSLRVTSTRPSRSKPDRGLVQIQGELQDQHQVLKLQMTAWGLFGMRPERATKG